MVTSVRGFMVEGRCFAEGTRVPVFVKPEQNVALLYGGNGTGKTTLATAIESLGVDQSPGEAGGVTPGEEGALAIQCLNGSGQPLDFAAAHPATVFSVFSRDFLSRSLDVRDSGLETIVLFDTQLEAQADLEELDRELEGKREELAQLSSRKQVEVESVSDQEKLVKRQLQLGWAERKRRILDHKRAAAVNLQVVDDVGRLGTEVEREELTTDAFEERLAVLQRAKGLPQQPLPKTVELPKDFNADEYASVLAKMLPKAELDSLAEAMREAMAENPQAFALTQEAVETAAKTCPVCYQPITAEWEELLATSLAAVLNRETQELQAQCDRLSLPPVTVVGTDDLLPHWPTEVKEVLGKLGELNSAVEAVNGKLARKKSDPGVDMQFSGGDLIDAVEHFGAASDSLKQIVEAHNAAVAGWHEEQARLVAFNDDLAAVEIQGEYRELVKRRAVLEATGGEENKLQTQVENLEGKRDEAAARRKNVEVAVAEVNAALEFIFLARDRLRLATDIHEGGQPQYVLTARGIRIAPSQVSSGERNALGLAYFTVKAKEQRELNPDSVQFLVFDDPVTSRDAGNRVGVLSLLNRQILETVEDPRSRRMFVLTHDLLTLSDLFVTANRTSSGKGSKAKMSVLELQEVKGAPCVQEMSVKRVEELREYKQLLEVTYLFSSAGLDEITASQDLAAGMNRSGFSAAFVSRLRHGVVRCFDSTGFLL